jgi:hypothetical protein
MSKGEKRKRAGESDVRVDNPGNKANGEAYKVSVTT